MPVVPHEELGHSRAAEADRTRLGSQLLCVTLTYQPTNMGDFRTKQVSLPG